MTIVIIGAGIAGLTTAIALARRGVRSVIYEQAPVLEEVGAGISISPNAGRVLLAIGLDDAMQSLGAAPKQLNTLHYKTGEHLYAMNQEKTLEKHGIPYLQMHRADLHGALSNAARDTGLVSIETDHMLSDAKQENGMVKLSFASGASTSAETVIGADGLRSIIREIFLDSSEPTFTGHVAWRAIVSMDGLPDFIPRDTSTVFMGRDDHMFVCYPVRASRSMNCVAFRRTNEWVAEDWRQRGDKNDLVAAFADWHEIVVTLINAIPNDECLKWGLFARKPLHELYDRQIVLIGDAAHPMLPFLGQGAAMGIEDAMILARCLLDYEDREKAFAQYQHKRLERVLYVQNESFLQADRIQRQKIDRSKMTQWVNEDSLGLFDYDPVTVPIG